MRIYQLFFEVFSRSKSKDIFLALIEDVFSPTEKIMIAKRIAIFYLLIKGLDYRTIADTLKVSPATVVTYGLLSHKRETKLVEIIKNMLLKEKALGFLEDIFAELFIQPGFKIGHYQLKWQHQKRKWEREVLG